MRDTLTASLGTPARGHARPGRRHVMDFAEVPKAAWHALTARSLGANAFYNPDWACAAARHARNHAGGRVLLAWDRADPERLLGLLPVASAWDSLKLPLPLLVAWHGYAPLATPLLDRERGVEAAAGLMDAARAFGARGLLLSPTDIESAATQAFVNAASVHGGRTRILHRHARAMLDCRQDADAVLRTALGPKKLKELRRQRNRLEDGGAVTFEMISDPQRIPAALEAFLQLEASGWKAKRGTALAQHDGDLRFIREAVPSLAAQGLCDIAMLSCAGRPVAAGIVLRQGRRAFFFKIGSDPDAARISPGVQLTVDLTRNLCADPDIDDVDSTADANHPMIDRLWPGRLAMGDVLVPLGADGPVLRICEHALRKRRRMRAAARTVANRIRTLRERLS